MEIFIPVLIVALIGLVAGVGLAFASKYMAVPVDERVEKLTEVLPGANCGACGYSGCEGYAAAIASGEAEPNKCAPGGEAAATAIAEIMDVEVSSEKLLAYIACKGSPEITKLKYEYSGKKSCAAASLLHAGPLECAFGCVGYGDCASACPFGAITVKDGKPIVCEELCVGCGICAKACPKNLISIVPVGRKVSVGCSNRGKGAKVVKACEVSCIACKLCEKACESGALKIVDNLATIDYSICNGCGKCKEACKRGVLI